MSINTSDWKNCVQPAESKKEEDFAKGGVQIGVTTITSEMELGSHGSHSDDLQ
jgi:hypothetical protein